MMLDEITLESLMEEQFECFVEFYCENYLEDYKRDLENLKEVYKMMNGGVDYPRIQNASPSEIKEPYEPSLGMYSYEQPLCLGSTFIDDERMGDLDTMEDKAKNPSPQITNNVNNANAGGGGGNGRNGGNNGCTYKGFMACNPKEYDGKRGAIALTRWIEKMENVNDNSGCAENQKVKYDASLFVNKALPWWNTQVQARGRAAAIGMSWTDFKALLVEEFCPSNEMEKLESEFWNHKMVGANHVGYTDRFHELAKLVPHLVTPESSRIKSAILKVGILTDEAVSCGTLTKGNEKRNGVKETSKQEGRRNDDKRAKKPGHIARHCETSIKQVAPINAVRGNHELGMCYEYGSRKNYQNNCPKLTRAPGQMGNCLTIKENQNTKNNENQFKGRDFNVNAVGTLQDPNIITGTFSLNNHYATVLFDSGANFSFISTDFVTLLNVKTSFVNLSYVIEVADGKNVEVDRIIRDFKLKIGTSLFTIDLIPLGHRSFDVIVGMDWLSEHKAKIVCHEKVVRIPLESREILHIQEEHTLGIAKALNKFVIVFIDGILVYSKSKDEHEVYLRLVLEFLKKEYLCVKFSKCEFWLQGVQFLGHVVNQNGIHVDPSKIEAVKNWKAPTTPSKIRSLLGLAEDFIVYYDASNQGLGCVLMQRGKSVIHMDHKSLQHIFNQKELNMRQVRWIELFSNHECEIRYHLGKANLVADALIGRNE
nr:zinc finger, CCHC-type, retrotransposon Gag domain protein [Tanacetum cinerariifolium]